MHVIKGYGVWFILAPPKKWSNYGLAMHFVIKLGWGFPANGFAAFSSSPILLFMTEMWKSRPLKLLYLLVEWRCSRHVSSQYSQPKCKLLGLQHTLQRAASLSACLQQKGIILCVDVDSMQGSWKMCLTIIQDNRTSRSIAYVYKRQEIVSPYWKHPWKFLWVLAQTVQFYFSPVSLF